MRHLVMWCVMLSLAVAVTPTDAVTIDGKLDPEYGAPLSVQTTQTSLDDGWDLHASELDQAFGFVESGVLHLLFGGNYNRYEAEFIVYPNQLHIYLDTGPGGQNELSAANPNVGSYSNVLATMAGLRFDADFAPDYWIGGERGSSGTFPYYLYYAELPAGGGGVGYYLGAADFDGSGTLATGDGASNPYGILGSIDISNTAGVTAGCGASSGAGVTTGVELAIPLPAIGNPSGPIRVCALLRAPYSGVSNQVLGPVPEGTCALGSPSNVDFGNIPGAQFFVIDVATPVLRPSWGHLKAGYR